jgi:hypothetical protein
MRRLEALTALLFLLLVLGAVYGLSKVPTKTVKLTDGNGPPEACQDQVMKVGSGVASCMRADQRLEVVPGSEGVFLLVCWCPGHGAEPDVEH